MRQPTETGRAGNWQARLTRRQWLVLASAATALGAWASEAAASAGGDAAPEGARRIGLTVAATGEQTSLAFGTGEPPPAEMAAISRLLRDWRTGQVLAIDPELVRLLADLAAHLTSSAEREITYTVLSGYRSPETNALLAQSSRWVAVNSLHIQGRAVDIRIGGVPIAAVHAAALDLRRGGVGYYPSADFVHVDTGPFRTWSVDGGNDAEPLNRLTVPGARLAAAPAAPPIPAASPVPAASALPAGPSLGGMPLGAGGGTGPTLGGQRLGGRSLGGRSLGGAAGSGGLSGLTSAPSLGRWPAGLGRLRR